MSLNEQLAVQRGIFRDKWFAQIVETSLLFTPEVFDEIFISQPDNMGKHLYEKYRIDCRSNLGAFFNLLDPRNTRLLYQWMERKADETELKFMTELKQWDPGDVVD